MKITTVILLGILFHLENVLGNKVVAKFPASVWSGSCDPATLRYLPNKCSEIITKDSPPEQKLACSIISNENSYTRIPFGMYPPNLMLDTELSSVGSESLVQIFDQCAMAKMISDGCFTFEIDLSRGSFFMDSFLNADEYSSKMESKHGSSFQAGLELGFINVNAGYTSNSKYFSSSSSTNALAQLSKEWNQNIGILSMETCKNNLMDYFDPKYIQTLNDAVQVAEEYRKKKMNLQTNTELHANPKFTAMMSRGYLIPMSFQYAIRYAGIVDIRYSDTTTTTTSVVKHAITAGLSGFVDVFFGGVSTETENIVTRTATSHNVKISTSSYDVAYGHCDFSKALANNASEWTQVFLECAQAVANDFSLMDSPALIPDSGFANLFDIMERSNSRKYIKNEQNIPLTKTFAPLVRTYYSYCSCLPNRKYFECYDIDGKFKRTGMFESAECNVPFFAEGDTPYKESKAILGEYFYREVQRGQQLDPVTLLEGNGFQLLFNGKDLEYRCPGKIPHIIWPEETFHYVEFRDATSLITSCSIDTPACNYIGPTSLGRYALQLTDDKGNIYVMNTVTGEPFYHFTYCLPQ